MIAILSPAVLVGMVFNTPAVPPNAVVLSSAAGFTLLRVPEGVDTTDSAQAAAVFPPTAQLVARARTTAGADFSLSSLLDDVESASTDDTESKAAVYRERQAAEARVMAERDEVAIKRMVRMRCMCTNAHVHDACAYQCTCMHVTTHAYMFAPWPSGSRSPASGRYASPARALHLHMHDSPIYMHEPQPYPHAQVPVASSFRRPSTLPSHAGGAGGTN